MAVISLTAARRYWGGAGQSLGKRLVVESGAGGAPSLPATVVGVVGDTANADTVRPAEPQIYLAAAQQPPRGFALVLRGSRPPEALAGAVRRAIAEVDPELAVYQLRSLRAAIASERQSNGIIISLLGAFAELALLLATVGLYGVMAYAVAQRQRELAVRTVCGASPRDLRMLVLAQGMRLALLGAAVGLALGLALSHLISSKLFGVTPTDVPTFAAALVTVLWTAAVATLLPALRAERVSPAQALRSD